MANERILTAGLVLGGRLWYGNYMKNLDKGTFRELKDRNEFNAVQPFLGSIQWRNGQDFCPDTLYLDSKQVEEISAESFDEAQPEISG